LYAIFLYLCPSQTKKSNNKQLNSTAGDRINTATKNMKKLFIVLALCFTCHALVAQDLIKPINGKSFFAEIQSIENGIVNYQVGVSKMTMPTSEIALIEFKEGGVQYFHTESLKEIDPKNDVPAWKKGHKVYIPFSDENEAKRSGALKLRELVAQGGSWEVADCKEEAHFVLDFAYSEGGLGRANVVMKEKSGATIVQTPNIMQSLMNSGKAQKTKGEVLAKAQYDKYVGRIASGRLEFEKGHLFFSGRRMSFVIRPESTVGYGFKSESLLIKPTLTLGCQFNPYFFLGVGSGWNYIPDSGWGKQLMSLPIYGNLRAYLGDKVCTPFFDLKVGYNYPLKEYQRYYERPDEYGNYYENLISLKGLDANITFGLEIKHFDIGFTASAYTFQRCEHSFYYDMDYNYQTHTYTPTTLHDDYFYYNKWDWSLSLYFAYNIQIRKKSSY